MSHTENEVKNLKSSFPEKEPGKAEENYEFLFSLKEGESSNEFPCINTDIHKFMLHYKKGILCIEYRGKSYREIGFRIKMEINGEKVNFVFNFCQFSNNFYFSVKEHSRISIKISVELHEIINQFCGLVNLGATCYINSLLQALRYMGEYQEDLFTSINNGYYNLMLKRLFYAMSTKSSADFMHVSALIKNLPFVSSLAEHQDVHEFNKILFDKLEKEDKEVIKRNFEGKLETEFALKCGCVIKKEEFYQDLQLNVVKEDEEISLEKDSIKEEGETFLCKALRKISLPDEIEEFNCETHNKTSAVRKTFIKTTPKFLFLLINRFCFDWETMEFSKNNSFFSFPPEFSINEELFVLHSVIVHSGNTAEGHFYSYVKVNGKFYKFNDSQVHEVLEEEAIDWNFGGKNFFTGRIKNYSGYYLIYRKATETSEKNVFVLESVPKALTDDPIKTTVRFLKNSMIKDYDGIGPFNLNNKDYPLTPTEEIQLSQFDNVSAVFRGFEVFQVKQEEFLPVKDTNINFNDPLLLYSGETSGKLVFVKEFSLSNDLCFFPGDLKMQKLVRISKIDQLFNFYGEVSIYREDLNEKGLCSEITEFDQVKDWDILIVTLNSHKELSSYLMALKEGQYVFVDFNSYKIPLFIEKNLSKGNLQGKLQELLFAPLLKVEETGFMDKNTKVTVSFDIPVKRLFVGCAFGKVDINSLTHVHPLIVEKSLTAEELIKKFRTSKFPCMKMAANKKITVIQTWKNSARLKIYGVEMSTDDYEAGSLTDCIEETGMVVLTDYIENPLVVCFVDSSLNLINYPLVIEKVETIKIFREKFMILSNLYRSNGDKYFDNEIIDGKVLIQKY